MFGLNSSNERKSLVPTRQSAGENKNFKTIISEGSVIKGTIQFNESIFINGEVDSELIASISSNSEGIIWIGPRGHVIGQIKAKQIHVEGRLEGNAHSEENLVIYSTAHISGDCFYNNVSMDVGAQLMGRLVPQYRKDKLSFEKNDQATNFELPSLEKEGGKKRPHQAQSSQAIFTPVNSNNK